MDERRPDQQSTSSPQVQRAQNASQRLGSVVESSTKVLTEATTVFPFTLFPTTIKIDREKATVMHRVFFRVFEVISIQLNDIVGVVASAGPAFGSLRIFNRHHAPEEAIPVNYLRRRDALKIKRLLEGHIIARERGVDLTVLSNEELVAKLLALGAGTPAENI